MFVYVNEALLVVVAAVCNLYLSGSVMASIDLVLFRTLKSCPLSLSLPWAGRGQQTTRLTLSPYCPTNYT